MLDITGVSQRPQAVGITKGPGESTHEYTFVSRDDAQELKNGEYVYYELDDPDGTVAAANGTSMATTAATRRVLGRILKRVPLQLYPDTFLAEPEISPSQVAAMVDLPTARNPSRARRRRGPGNATGHSRRGRSGGARGGRPGAARKCARGGCPARASTSSARHGFLRCNEWRVARSLGR